VDEPEKTLLNFVTNLGYLKHKPAAQLARESVNSNKVFAKVFRVEAKVPGGETMSIVIIF
jgi:hypothetical protein